MSRGAWRPLSEAQRRLAADNVEFADAIAADMWRIRPSNLLEDLRAAGALGLCRAARDFDPACGVKFSTYAWHKIRGAILDWLRASAPSRRGVSARPTFVGVDAVAGLSDPAPLADSVLEAAEAADHAARAAQAACGTDLRVGLVRAMYVDGLDLTRAAERMGVSKSWASRQHAAAVAEIRDAAPWAREETKGAA